jgi:hypothetical protein
MEYWAIAKGQRNKKVTKLGGQKKAHTLLNHTAYTLSPTKTLLSVPEKP